MQMSIRPIAETDRWWVRKFIGDRWGADFIVVHGVVYYPHELRGYIAETKEDGHVGLATYVVENSACELVSLDSLKEGEGIGTALVRQVAEEASISGCTRLWCITTNDNFPALRFYQKRGFRIVAVHPGAVERSRVMKPSIPLWGIDSIPIRDEIELEIPLP
jgi:ribosomal protein S18 acetylase RimI-like enzyme